MVYSHTLQFRWVPSTYGNPPKFRWFQLMAWMLGRRGLPQSLPGSNSCIVKDCACKQCPKSWGKCFTGRVAQGPCSPCQIVAPKKCSPERCQPSTIGVEPQVFSCCDWSKIWLPCAAGPEHSKSFNLPLFKVTNNTNSPNLKQAIVRGPHLRKMVLGQMLTHNPPRSRKSAPWCLYQIVFFSS